MSSSLAEFVKSWNKSFHLGPVAVRLYRFEASMASTVPEALISFRDEAAIFDAVIDNLWGFAAPGDIWTSWVHRQKPTRLMVTRNTAVPG